MHRLRDHYFASQNGVYSAALPTVLRDCRKASHSRSGRLSAASTAHALAIMCLT